MNYMVPRKRPKLRRKLSTVIRCGGHRTFVRKHYCVALGKDPAHPCSGLDVDAHHTTTRGAGGGDETCVPMCRAHHQLLDSWGWSQKRFEREFKVDLAGIAQALASRSPALRRKMKERT